MRVALPAELARYVVEKGSITVDGVSLTVVEVGPDWFTVSPDPHDPGADHAGPQGDRRPRQPRGRRHRQVRRADAAVGGRDERTSTGDRRRRQVRARPGRATRSTRSRAGRAVVVVDDEDRENEGDLIFAAQRGDARARRLHDPHTCGYICVPMQGADLDRLELPPMTRDQRGPQGHRVRGHRRRPRRASRPASPPRTAPAPSGCWPTRRPSRTELTRPGHVFPLRADAGRGAAPRGPHRGRVDLARLAGLEPGRRAVRARQRRRLDDARAASCRAFADEHGLVMISIADLIAYRRHTEQPVAARGRDRAARPSTASSAPSATAPPSTAPSTSRSCAATSATATTCWCACTPSASPATSSARCAATAGRSSTRRCAAVAEEGRGVVALHARARGPRHRPGAQAAGLPAAGRRRRHRRRQPRARPARRRPRLRHRRADPRRPRRPRDAAADQQPGQARGPRGLRAVASSSACRSPIARERRTTSRYLRTKRDRMGHDLPARPGRRIDERRPT